VMWRYCSVNACGIRNGIEKKSCAMRPQLFFICGDREQWKRRS